MAMPWSGTDNCEFFDFKSKIATGGISFPVAINLAV